MTEKPVDLDNAVGIRRNPRCAEDGGVAEDGTGDVAIAEEEEESDGEVAAVVDVEKVGPPVNLVEGASRRKLYKAQLIIRKASV